MINEFKSGQTWKIWPSPLSLSLYSTFNKFHYFSSCSTLPSVREQPLLWLINIIKNSNIEETRTCDWSNHEPTRNHEFWLFLKVNVQKQPLGSFLQKNVVLLKRESGTDIFLLALQNVLGHIFWQKTSGRLLLHIHSQKLSKFVISCLRIVPVKSSYLFNTHAQSYTLNNNTSTWGKWKSWRLTLRVAYWLLMDWLVIKRFL